jgi:hypothetical protein
MLGGLAYFNLLFVVTKSEIVEVIYRNIRISRELNLSAWLLSLPDVLQNTNTADRRNKDTITMSIKPITKCLNSCRLRKTMH